MRVRTFLKLGLASEHHNTNRASVLYALYVLQGLVEDLVGDVLPLALLSSLGVLSKGHDRPLGPLWVLD